MLANREALVVAFVAFAVYINALFNGFVFDDIPQVLKNPWIKDFRHLHSIFFENMWGFVGETSNYYRPLNHIGYLLIYQVFRTAPWGYHLANVIQHMGVSVLVYLISAKLFDMEWGKTEGRYFSASFVVATLFATHPVHTEVVAAVMGISDLSFSFFYLLAFYLYVKYSEELRFPFALSVLSFFLAILCKEPALTLPFILVAFDCLYRKEKLSVSWVLKRYAPFLFALAVYLAMRLFAIGAFVSSRPHVELTKYAYLINTLPLFKLYLEMLILPVNLNFLHTFHPITSLMTTDGIVSILLVTTMAGVALISFRKNRILFLGLLLIVLPLLPSLYIPGLNQEIENAFAERYLYLPSFGFVLILGALIRWAGTYRARAGTVACLALAVLTIPYSIATIQRNVAWKNNFSLFEDTIVKSPESAYAHIFLGHALYSDKGDVDGAIKQYRIALELKPDNADAHNKLGIAFLRKGWVDNSIAEHMLSLELNPSFLTAYNNLGLAFLEKGWIDMAMQQFAYALKRSPAFIEAYNNMGIALYRKGRIQEALYYYSMALRLNPEFANAHNNIGVAYADYGSFDKAIWHFEEAVRLDPKDTNAQKNLARAKDSKFQTMGVNVHPKK